MFYKVCAAYTYASGKIWMILKYFWGLKTSLAQRTQLNHICTQRPTRWVWGPWSIARCIYISQVNTVTSFDVAVFTWRISMQRVSSNNICILGVKSQYYWHAVRTTLSNCKIFPTASSVTRKRTDETLQQFLWSSTVFRSYQRPDLEINKKLSYSVIHILSAVRWSRTTLNSKHG